ncbi:hypothetical protein N9926_00970 [Flavobacteriaceae bacterium]|nr:hypothetical protein [Flavobacteriaceae bacterium]
MINNFKKPDLNAPRYRSKRLSLLNKETIEEFKSKYPLYEGIDNEKIKKIIRLYNKKLWEGVINNRDGVELPDSLGYLFIGSCAPGKTLNIDYNLSNKYGKVLRNKNWNTDGNIGKIFYTNFSTKYRFKNRNLWMFQAVRDFKRSVAEEYPKNWQKYLFMKNKYKVTHLYKDKTNKEDLNLYNEFED